MGFVPKGLSGQGMGRGKKKQGLPVQFTKYLG
jgi:hypothetical protein